MSSWQVALTGATAVGLGYFTYRCISRKYPTDGKSDARPEGWPSALQHFSAIATGQAKLPRISLSAVSRLALCLMAPGLNRGLPAAVVSLSEQVKRISLDSKRRLQYDSEEDHINTRADFFMSHGLTSAEAQDLLKQWGRNELVGKVTPTWLIVFRLLTGPMPIMLWTAAIVEGVLGNYLGICILLGIQFVNAGFSFYEILKADRAVAALKASLNSLATVKRDGRWTNMDAGFLVPGDLVKLAAGIVVPADCYVNEGEIEVDQSTWTGEPLPVKFRYGDVCKMGSMVTRGESDGTVETTGRNSLQGQTAAKLHSVENVTGSMPTSLLGLMKVLFFVPLSLCMTSFTFFVVNGNNRNTNLPHMFEKGSAEIVKDALTFAGIVLIAAIPLAIQLVTTRTLSVASLSLARHGIIVNRLAALEELAGLNMLCFDKTGTLTLNKMAIQDDCTTFAPNETRDTILFQAALASKWNEPPRDTIDTMILATGLRIPQMGDIAEDPEGVRNLKELNKYSQIDYEPFDPRTKRTEGKLKAPDGSIFRITKGAPHVIINMSWNRDEIRDCVNRKVHELGIRGIRSLAVGRQDNEDGRWRFLGLLSFIEAPRSDTKHTIEMANLLGLEVKMVTGDHKVIATETARMLGMGWALIEDAQGLPVFDADRNTYIGEKYGELIVPASGFAQVFPEHKYVIVETLQQVGYRCGMVGDGVGDAAALKRANVGIAVQGSTDAARAAADIVLTENGLGGLITAIKVARDTLARLKSFVSYTISASLQLPMFFSIALLTLPPRLFFDRVSVLASVSTSVPASMQTPKTYIWPSFFQLPAPMLMLIKLLNDGALLLSSGCDRVLPSPIPQVWDLGILFTVSCVLGAVSCGSSLLLLWAALDSNNPKGIFAGMGIPPVEYGKIITMMYLKVSITDLLTYFSGRTQGGFFWEVAPSGYLLSAAAVSLSISTFLASFWPEGALGGLPVMGLALGDYKLMPLWIWIYCIAWWFIQDTAKVATTRILMSMPCFRSFKVDRRKYERGQAAREKNATQQW